MTRNKKVILLIIGSLLLAGAIAAVIFFVVIIYPLINNPFNDRKFDQTVWVSYHDSTDPDNPRGNMVSNLQKKYLQLGMSKQEVLRLLGEPDYEESSTVYKYNLGVWSGFRIDYDSLDVHFDSSGRLTHTQVVQH